MNVDRHLRPPERSVQPSQEPSHCQEPGASNQEHFQDTITVDVLVAEIGSTTTVVNAFTDLGTSCPRFLGQGVAPTSVQQGDVTIGLNQAILQLQEELGGDIQYQRMLAASSAAGGLRMTVHGLAYEMTARAAREAALGAGAVLKMVTAGHLRDGDLREIMDINPNIVLLAGGVDHGERDTAIANARRLAELDISAPVIFAGNIACREEVVNILESGGKQVIPVENVYPRIDELNIEPTRAVIQDVFEDHIIHAPGMSKIREMVAGTIMPTPGAVMAAAKLLRQSIGDLLVLDVGGATTDVHSVTAGSEEISRLSVSPEPIAKRTVEGDLGVYVNVAQIRKLIKPAEADAIDLDLDEALLDWPPIPSTEEQFAALQLLTSKAVEVALERHVGKLKHLYGPGGRSTVAQGKDLTAVKWVVATGGPLTKLSSIDSLIARGLRISVRQELFPRNWSLLIDHDYNLAVLGALGKEYPEGALNLMLQSLRWEENNA